MPEGRHPDCAELAAIHGAAFTMPRPWSSAEIESLLADDHCFLFQDPPSPVTGPVAGFLIGRVIADEAELLTLAVRPDHRREGIGARLVQAFLAEARSRGATRAFLEVSAANDAALALYAETGFAPAGRRKGYYRTGQGQAFDALVLSHALAAPVSSRDTPDF